MKLFATGLTVTYRCPWGYINRLDATNRLNSACIHIGAVRIFWAWSGPFSGFVLVRAHQSANTGLAHGVFG